MLHLGPQRCHMNGDLVQFTTKIHLICDGNTDGKSPHFRRKIGRRESHRRKKKFRRTPTEYVRRNSRRNCQSKSQGFPTENPVEKSVGNP